MELTFSLDKSQAALLQKVSLAMTKKTLDTAELKGQQMVEMLQTSQAPHPVLGNTIDFKG